MNSPLSTDINIEKKWNGYESVGRFSGEPGIFLYYGDEGVDKNYTVNSITKELDGYNWTDKISSHGSHIVFSSFPDCSRDPLDGSVTKEIIDFLKIQTHDTVRISTSGNHEPDSELDDFVDYYTVVVPDDGYMSLTDENGSCLEWFSERYKPEDKVDFVFGIDKAYAARDGLRKLKKKYVIGTDRMWLYPEDKEDFQETFNAAKSLGLRFCLPPDYYRLVNEEPEKYLSNG